MQILLILSSPQFPGNQMECRKDWPTYILNEGDEVTIFLNGPAVDLLQGNSETVPLAGQDKLFTLSEGVLVG